MNLQPFKVVVGAAPYLPQANLDTDVIIRIERLTALPREALGPFALESLRYHQDGSENSGFVLNQRPFRFAPILLAGENFGCGSSREGAVWALQGIGIRCVIAPSFGDIFFSNCFQNGVLPIRLPTEQVGRLAEVCRGGDALTVDLERCVLKTPDGQELPFSVDPSRRQGLVHGLDDIGLTFQHNEEILAWQHADRQRRPWAWSTVARR